MTIDIQIDRNAKRSIDGQIVDFIRGEILAQRLTPGDRLPPTQELVRQIGVSSHTLRRALTALEDEGLVEATPGRGTFVRRSRPHPNGNGNHKRRRGVKRLAIICPTLTYAAPASRPYVAPDRYRGDTVAGIMQECERQGVILEWYCECIVTEMGDSLTEKLKAGGFDGVAWFLSGESEWSQVQQVARSGIPMVVSSRTHLDHDLPCSEGDYESAGYVTGRHFCNKGLRKAAIVCYFSAEEAASTVISKHGVYPVGLRQGLARAFDFQGESVEVYTIEGYDANARGQIRRMLEGLDSDTGVLFSSGYQFGDFVKADGAVARNLLTGREYVVVSNRQCTVSFMGPALRLGLDFWLLADPFEQNSRTAIQKLVNQIDGNLDNTKTLVRIPFVRFLDSSIVRGDFSDGG